MKRQLIFEPLDIINLIRRYLNEQGYRYDDHKFEYSEQVGVEVKVTVLMPIEGDPLFKS